MSHSFLIAAPHSGSGKTTIARGLMALLTQKGYRVQPFKCGPDYIDTKFHAAVCGRPSINLDTFMATPEHVRELFQRYGEGADVCIVEGMMGLYDGYDRDRGSSAEIARVLDIPVVLVVDAKSAAYSTAALLSGFLHFGDSHPSVLRTAPLRQGDSHPSVLRTAPLRQGGSMRFAGVIFNKVGSEKHYRMLQEVCDDLQVECLGYLPKSAELEQGSRYLGLDFSEIKSPKLGGWGSEQVSIDLDRLLHLTTSPSIRPLSSPNLGGGKTLIARNDESFSFLYQETIDALGQVDFFDPETEVLCLDNVDLLYLPGGYPEKHLEALVKAEATRRAIKDYAERGGRIIAECGGMMYLCEAIVTDAPTPQSCEQPPSGRGAVEYPMCGVLPYKITARQEDRKLSLGYRRFVLDGKEYRGHEFHYTQFLGETPKSVTQVYNAKGEPVDTPVFRYKNVLASYTHLYLIDS